MANELIRVLSSDAARVRLQTNVEDEKLAKLAQELADEKEKRFQESLKVTTLHIINVIDNRTKYDEHGEHVYTPRTLVVTSYERARKILKTLEKMDLEYTYNEVTVGLSGAYMRVNTEINNKKGGSEQSIEGRRGEPFHEKRNVNWVN